LAPAGAGPISPRRAAGAPQRQQSAEAIVAWLSLVVAGLFEVVWAVGLKYTDGFSRLWPSVFTVVAMVLSVLLLEYAVRSVPVGTAYAVWVGIGAVGTAVFGMILFGESREPLRLLCLALIVAGVVGLKLVTREAS
jgi:quaternary ammonium compound-resistance protein SugE